MDEIIFLTFRRTNVDSKINATRIIQIGESNQNRVIMVMDYNPGYFWDLGAQTFIKSKPVQP